MAKKSEKNMMIMVTLTDEDLKALTVSVPAAYGSDPEKINGIATALLQSQARGGMMLGRECMEMIQAVTGPLNEDADIVPWVEKAANKDGGTTIVSWRVDPTYYPLLEQIAEGQGRTVDQVCQDSMDWVTGQGWLYDFSYATTSIPIPNEDMDWLRKEIGKEHITSEDLMSYIHSLRKPGLEMVKAS